MRGLRDPVSTRLSVMKLLAGAHAVFTGGGPRA